MTSSEFPTASPRGLLISVIIAEHFFPASLATRTIASASFSASCSFFINAPSPTLTSSTIPSAPVASFLLIIDEHISGMLSTVAVAFLKAYSFLSAGTREPVCPATAKPTFFTAAIKSPNSIEVENPGIDSSLSIVPPVCPSPRPDIFGT